MKYSSPGIAFALLAACTSPDHVTTPGLSVYNARVRKLQLETRGGGLAGPPRSDTPCDPGVATYTVAVASRELAWQYCQVVVTGEITTYTPRAGARALDGTEWKALESQLAALVVSGVHTCGADKGEQAVIVSTDESDFEYGDDFYACRDRSKPYIVGQALDAALGAARRATVPDR